jgi:SAM-dependent methyltransferase
MAADYRQDRERLSSAYETRALDLDEINESSPWHRLYRTITADRLASLHVPVPRAIDLAAGTGLTAEVLCELGYEVTAVETLPVMLRILRRKAALRGVEVFDFDLTSVDEFIPSGFGLATCTQAINFMPRLGPIFSRARDCLSPGGILYVDIDTTYRWTVIETLAGRPANALSILNECFDVGRHIVGADYFFYSKNDVVSALKYHGFSDISAVGILPLAPLLHILHESADFLDRPRLLGAAAHYASEDGFNKLRQLDEMLSGMIPTELCGFIQFTAIRR